MTAHIRDLGCPAVCVTFLDELVSFYTHTVSMMGTVDQHDSTARTYQAIRKSADGLAYAAHIAQKYQFTYEALCKRLRK